MARVKKYQNSGKPVRKMNFKSSENWADNYSLDTTGLSKGSSNYYPYTRSNGTRGVVTRSEAKSLVDKVKSGKLKKSDWFKSGGKVNKIKKAQTGNTTPEANKPEANKKVRLKEDSRDYITKIKTDSEGNVASLKSRRTLKGFLTGAPRAKKIMKGGGKVVKKSTSKSKKK